MPLPTQTLSTEKPLHVGFSSFPQPRRGEAANWLTADLKEAYGVGDATG